MKFPDDVNQQISEHYDRTQYTSNAFPYSSPGHLRAAAHLYGVETVPVNNARVLELGCAAGGNLLPFVLAYPDARAIGVDLSPVQIQQGQKIVQDLGIANLDLRAMNLMDIGKGFGEFDYIIVHGVFSWVPPEVRDAILRICRENLSAKGIAYISYNTYPGWKAGDIVRDAMLLHSHAARSDEEKLASAKAMLTLLSDGLAASNTLGPSLRHAAMQLRKQSDYYVVHEYLETFNAPCYFLEFADAVEKAGLAYVGDAESHSELSTTYGKSVQLNLSVIAMGQSKVLRQQYLDFAVGRNFRKSLVINQLRSDQPAIAPDLGRLRELQWAGHFTEIDPPPRASPSQSFFNNHRGRPFDTSEASIIAVIRALTQVWPATLGIDDLVEQISSESAADSDRTTVENAVCDALETLYKLNQLQMRLDNSPYDNCHGRKPNLISGFSYLYERSQEAPVGVGVGQFNFWHDGAKVRLKECEAFLVPYIDGSNTIAELSRQLRDALYEGKVIAPDGKALKGQRNLDAKAQDIVMKLLKLLKRVGALI